MAFVTLDDGQRPAEIVVFNETFDAARHLLREDQLVDRRSEGARSA